MNYPLDVEICVNEFTKTEGSNDTNIKFLRAYVNVLNGFYKEGLNNSVNGVAEEVFNSETYKSELRECFMGHYEEFLTQAKDAYKQGQLDTVKGVSGDLSHNIKDIGSIQENGGTYYA